MNDGWVIVPYEHGPTTGTIELGAGTRTTPPTSWRPAYPDIVDGQRVARARFPEMLGQVRIWIRDRDGERPARHL